MIDPTKLTAENGFVDGVVVEYQIERGGHGVDYLCFDGPFALDFKQMTHIKPLTGPMAIWNFAPEWAEWCMVWEDGEVWWSPSKPKSNNDWTVTERPFWAIKE